MGVRLEQLMGLATRIGDIETTLKVFAMERLFETVIRLGKEKEAIEIAQIFSDIHFDRGEYGIDDLRVKLENLELATHRRPA
jgi:hypothetical protein